jgi:hypothetical protein
MKNILILFLSLFMLTSCVTPIKTQPTTIITQITQVELTPFPPKPNLTFTKKPVISASEDTFIVSDEMVEKSLLSKDYIDKVDVWKKKNNIK